MTAADENKECWQAINAEREWRETFDAMSDFVAVLDPDFHFRRVNLAMAEFLGKKPAELIGKRCHELMHGTDSPWPDCPHVEMLRTGRTATREVIDSNLGVPLLVTASPILGDDGVVLGSVHVARDISSIKNAHEDLARRNRELEALNSLSRKAMRVGSLDEVIQAAFASINKACSPDLILYYLIEGDWLALRGHYPNSEEHINEKKEVGSCLCGLAAELKKMVFSSDLFADQRCTLSECKDAGMHSFAALPLMQENEIIGVIGLASRKERDFATEAEFLETLAGTIGLVTRNALLIEELQMQTVTLDQQVKARTNELEERNRELERFNKLFVDREFRIKELRDRVKVLENKQ